jgi:hypothetical protein
MKNYYSVIADQISKKLAENNLKREQAMNMPDCLEAQEILFMCDQYEYDIEDYLNNLIILKNEQGK